MHRFLSLTCGNSCSHCEEYTFDAIMESLVGYGSDDESGDNYRDNKVRPMKKMFILCFHIYRLTD